MVRNLPHHESELDTTILSTLTIEAGEDIEFLVGVYEDIIPQPQLSLEFRPEHSGQIRVSLMRLDGYGDYTLKYYFVNPSTTTYKVTIRAIWLD